MPKHALSLAWTVALLAAWSPNLSAQTAQTPPRVTSPEVSAERRVTFRIVAPNAKAVRLAAANDLPELGQTAWLTRAENGVWEITVGPLEPGAYRYTFNVDGVTTIDPRNTDISQGFNLLWSVVHVPGSDLWDTKDVPHGAIAKVTYKSSALGYSRRMHVYTPPGYERGQDRYPVLYLLHGGTESDDVWSSVGRAGFILDNLIAAKKAKPMIVVMPNGHTLSDVLNTRGGPTQSAMNRFVADFHRDLLPYVDSHYRVLAGRADTAIAGVSFGGTHTLNVAIPRLERFGNIAVFSFGLFGAFRDLPGRGGGGAASRAASGTDDRPLLAREWEELHRQQLSNADLKKGLRLWFVIGKEDSSLSLARATVELFKKHGFAPIFKETEGGHSWMNWRTYLGEFVPQLFR